MNLFGKVLVVTGAAGGIGRELVLGFLSRGASVAAVDINKNALDKVVDQAGSNHNQLSTHVVDLTKKEEVERLPDQVIASHGTVDGIINNAGIIHPFMNINDLDYEEIKLVMDINFYGTLYMTKTFLPYLFNRPEGLITNISSMGGFLPVPGQTIYGASKAAVKLLTEGLFAELKDTNIHVAVVFPGGVGTDIMKNSGITGIEKVDATEEVNSQILTSKEAAEIMLNGIEANKNRIYAGKDSKIMDKLYRLSPKRAINMIAKQIDHLLNN